MLASRVLIVLGIALGGCSVERADVNEGRGGARGARGAVELGYTVDVEVPAGAARGQAAVAKVHVAPKAPWHMNLEYPAKLRLTAPDDVELADPLLEKGDAERFDDGGLVFAVLFTPQGKGARTIEAQVDFAVCGSDACGPVTESVQLAFEVGCRIEDTGLC